MANAATSLAFTAFYSTGDWNGYGKVKWTENETSACIYRVEYRLIAGSVWKWRIDAPKGSGVIGVDVRFAYAEPGADPERIVDQVKITCITIPDDASPAAATVNTPTLTPLHEQASALQVKCFGKIGDANGRVDLEWTDMTQFVRNGEIELTKFGVTSPNTKQLEYQEAFHGTPSGPRSNVGAPLPGRANFISIPLKLIPPGLPLPKAPPYFDPLNPPPSYKAAFPMWVTDGDLLTLKLVTFADGDGNNPKVSFFTFPFNREVTIATFTETATKSQAYSKQIEIITDIFSSATGVTFSCSGLPPGLTCSVGGLISGTPTTEGTYIFTITATSVGGVTATQTATIIVIPSTLPQITAPAQSQVLTRLVPVSGLQLRATNHPSSFAIVSGTLPAGLSLNTTTGVISGTPTTVEAAHNVVFKATNSVGDSPNYTVSFTVSSLATPVILSPTSFTAYLNDTVSYVIVTDIPATGYQANGLPTGLILLGNIISGVPSDEVGDYTVILRASNRIGTGPDFVVTVTVAMHAPVISSPPIVTAILEQPFLYTIAASNSPTSYGASGLPTGLSLNPVTGVISGIPTALGVFDITLIAINAGGSGTQQLILTVSLPPRPVIDDSATFGKAITTETGVQFTFQPAASNDPTAWRAYPVPDGLTLDLKKGTLSGIFSVPGLIGIVFIATNLGGDSDPVTFYFLVELGKELSLEVNTASIVTNIWVNLDDGKTSVNRPLGGLTGFTVKRGDSAVINILFHEEGIPADLIISGLKIGARTAYDEDYVVFSDKFLQIGPGAFTVYPDFSSNNEDLDSILVTTSLKLIGEIQWETVEPAVRRSTQQFDINILRDIVHPD